MRAVLEVDEAESAVLAELLLRGPQQPGELRTRASRMAAIATQERLTELLERLAAAGWVAQLGRRSGERSERWGQTLCPSAPEAAAPERPEPPRVAPGPGLAERVAGLEARVAALEALLRQLGG